MGMGNRQPLFQGRYNNEPSGLAPTSQANQFEAPSRVSPTQFDPSQLRMGGGKGGYSRLRPVQPQPQTQPQTPPRFDPTQFDPSQFRMSGGKGGRRSPGIVSGSNPYSPSDMNFDLTDTMPSAPIEDTQADDPKVDLSGGDPMIDPETGMDLRSDEFAQYIADKRNAEVAARNQPQPEPPPPAPFVRPRPTRGLFQNQSGIASLRGQYQPQRQTQYQPMRNLNAPRYPAPPRRPPPRSQPRNRYPQPPSRMPRPYPQPPRGGPSKGGFPPPQRRPSGPTKGGRPDPRYATLTGRPQPTIPFNPKFYGR